MSTFAAERAQEGLPYYDFPFRAADGRRHTVRFPTCYFAAPQFYYRDYPRFESKPRQLQCYLAGRLFYPIPMEQPEFTAEQERYCDFLRTTVQVGEELVEPQVFAKIVKQATLLNAVGGVPQAVAAKKGDGFKRNSSGLFNRQFTTDPEEAMRRVDSKLNRAVSSRVQMAENLRQSASIRFAPEGNESGFLGSKEKASPAPSTSSSEEEVTEK